MLFIFAHIISHIFNIIASFFSLGKNRIEAPLEMPLKCIIKCRIDQIISKIILGKNTIIRHAHLRVLENIEVCIQYILILLVKLFLNLFTTYLPISKLLPQIFRII